MRKYDAKKKPKFRFLWTFFFCKSCRDVFFFFTKKASNELFRRDGWLTVLSVVLNASPILARQTPFHFVLDDGNSTHGVGLPELHHCCAGERFHLPKFWRWWHICRRAQTKNKKFFFKKLILKASTAAKTHIKIQDSAVLSGGLLQQLCVLIFHLLSLYSVFRECFLNYFFMLLHRFFSASCCSSWVYL